MLTKDLITYLDELLDTKGIKDASQNGLQAEGPEEVNKIAFAVDACLASFEEAIAGKAQLLIVHHGLFWGVSLPVTGTHYQRMKTLIQGNVGLYASHLPLDMHPEVGHNAQLAKGLGLKEISPFAEYHGQTIGFSGTLEQPMKLLELSEKLEGITEQPVLRRDSFGPDMVSRIGIVSGGAADEVKQAALEGLDTYITGEPSHSNAHLAKELNMNVIYGGHWATETLGLKALASHLNEKFSLETFQIELPTGL